MEILIDRLVQEPLPLPPINQVVIYLSEEEARLLARYFGCTSRNNVANIMGGSQPTIDRIHGLTSGIYGALLEAGIE